MQLVTPNVRQIVTPQIDDLELSSYLSDVGANDRPAGIVDLALRYEGETLVEVA
jgi:hypothetical protein